MIKALKHLDGFYVVPWRCKFQNTLKSTVKLYYFFFFFKLKWAADKSVSAQEVVNKFPSKFSVSFTSRKIRKH